jgi:hypothetical protein
MRSSQIRTDMHLVRHLLNEREGSIRSTKLYSSLSIGSTFDGS